MRSTRHSLVVGLALALPTSSSAQDGLLRLACEGAQETSTVAVNAANNRKTKERKSATITVNPVTGLADFQNLGQVAFNMAKVPIECVVSPVEIFCFKDAATTDFSYSSSVRVNRYSGLLTESQMIIFSGANPFITSITGEYKCQAVEKPLF
jgi:hypothetical protein